MVLMWSLHLTYAAKTQDIGHHAAIITDNYVMPLAQSLPLNTSYVTVVAKPTGCILGHCTSGTSSWLGRVIGPSGQVSPGQAGMAFRPDLPLCRILHVTLESQFPQSTEIR